MHYVVGLVIVVATFAGIRYLLKSRTVVVAERPARVFHDEDCPICLENKSYPVQASCGHEFCGNV